MNPSAKCEFKQWSKVSVLALAAWIMGVLPVLPVTFVSLLIGILSVYFCFRKNMKGKIFAVIGLVLSVVGGIDCVLFPEFLKEASVTDMMYLLLIFTAVIIGLWLIILAMLYVICFIRSESGIR